MDRRTALQIAAAGIAQAAWGCARPSAKDSEPSRGSTGEPPRGLVSDRMPAIFLAHGSPLLLDDATWVAELESWARALPRPKAILVLSAHWVDDPISIGASRVVPLVYDFYGFPQKYYDVTYAAPGAPELASRLHELLDRRGPVVDAPNRGLDHGAYVPLVAMYPAADIPVIQVSIPTMDPVRLLELGRTLAPLRREGVLIMGSGFLTHNLGALDRDPSASPKAWATEFDAWCTDVIQRTDVDKLVDYRRLAPGVREALPTHEHFVPVVVAMGAALDDPGPVTFPISGFAYGSMTKRSVQLG